MQRIRLDEDIQPVTEFRTSTAALIERVRETKRPLVLTQRGHSAVVVVDVAQYERLREELELLRDIHAAETEIAQGLDVPHDEARRQALEALRRA